MKSETKTLLKISSAILIIFLFTTYWTSISDVLSKLSTAIAPLIVGCIIAYPLNILMSFFERHFFPRSKNKVLVKARCPISLLLAIISLLAIIAVILALIVPQLIDCAKLVIEKVPEIISIITEKILELSKRYNIDSSTLLEKLQTIDWQSSMSKIIETATTGVSNIFTLLVNAITSVVSGVTAAIIAVIFAIYLLLSKHKILKQFKRVAKRFMKIEDYKKSAHIISVVDKSFHGFIVGQCTEAIILGVLCAVGMLILKLPYAAMIGTVIGFSALIPVVGAFLGGAIGVLLILTVSPTKALIFLIFLLILQQLEGNLIYPKVVGSSIGLPAIWVLAAVTVGGGVAGIGGMVLGVPLTGAFYRLFGEYVNKKKESSDTEIPTEPTPKATPETE